jgi:hypothetical protein
MKKITILLTALLIAAFVLPNQSKAQSCPWLKKAGGNSDESSSAVATDASGNVYYVGYFASANVTFGTTTLHSPSGYAQMYIAKYDSCGIFKWAKSGGGTSNNTFANGVAVDAAGNIYVTGYFNCDTAFFGTKYLVDSAYRDVFLVKYNPNGGVIWAKQGHGNDNDLSFGISIDALNDVYIAGSFVSTKLTFGSNSVTNGTNDGSTYDVYVAKFDTAGNNAWVRGSTTNSSTSGYSFGYSVSSDASGNVYVGGQFEPSYIRFGADSLANNGYYDMFLVKYDANGNEQWLKSAGGSDEDGINGVASDAAGNVYVTGFIGGGSTVAFDGTHSLTNSNLNRAVFIAQYGSGGSVNWAKMAVGDYYSNNYANAISLDASGNAYITGTYTADSLKFGPVAIYNSTYLVVPSGTGNFMYDIFVAKYKANGVLSWARTAGGDSTDVGYGIATGPHGALYLSGYYRSPVLTVAGYTVGLATASQTGTGDAFISNNISTLPITPDICLVSADSINPINEYNVVYWDKTPYTTVSQFIILREVTSGVYKKIGSQPYSALSMFIDTARSVGPANGNPLIGTYRYKIQLLDTAGTYSFMSPYHNTVYFQNNVGTFNWNLYTVENTTITPVSQFDLVRDDNATGAWHVLSSIAGTQTSQTDPNYTTYQATADWRVEAQGFNCTPTLRLGHNSTQSAIVKSKSNISNNRGIGINNISNMYVLNVYPNPAKGAFVIETSSNEKQNVQVFDINGKVVLSTIITGTTNIDASALSEGVYNVNITNKNNVINQRLVIVK